MAIGEGSRGRDAAPKLGLVALTALVLGNMVGSGVFLLPAALAPFGALSLLGWLVSAGGAICFGLVIARLARRRPATGGPYAWTRDAFGDLPAFLVGWGYWISCWSGMAAIAIAMAGYLGELVPVVAAHPSLFAGLAIVSLWLVNHRGVEEAGLVQVLTTGLKVLPLIAIALFGFAQLEPTHFEPFNPTGRPMPSALAACLLLTLWAFQGFEAAAVAGEEAKDARVNVPRATLLGIALASLLYMASTSAVMGLLPSSSLATSPAPFAEAAEALWGEGAGRLVAAGAFVSCFGALNGWILVAGRMPYALARDGLFPAAFGKLSSRQTPGLGLGVSSVLAVGLVWVSYDPSLVDMFTTMTLLATLSALIPLLACALAELVLARRDTEGAGLGGKLLSGLALVYGLAAIVGSGVETVVWGLALLLGGLPVYGVMRRLDDGLKDRPRPEAQGHR